MSSTLVVELGFAGGDGFAGYLGDFKAEVGVSWGEFEVASDEFGVSPR